MSVSPPLYSGGRTLARRFLTRSSVLVSCGPLTDLKATRVVPWPTGIGATLSLSTSGTLASVPVTLARYALSAARGPSITSCRLEGGPRPGAGGGGAGPGRGGGPAGAGRG